MKQRIAGTYEQAVWRILGAFGVERAASIMGIRTAQAYRFADPESDQLPNVEQAAALDAAYLKHYGEAPIAQVYQSRLDEVTAQPKRVAGVHDELCDVNVQLGHLAGQVRVALADGRLSARERGDLQNSIAQTREELDELAEAVRRHGAGLGLVR